MVEVKRIRGFLGLERGAERGIAVVVVAPTWRNWTYSEIRGEIADAFECPIADVEVFSADFFDEKKPKLFYWVRNTEVIE
jgi:hypothetical protein